jgi:hypothetical protein
MHKAEASCNQQNKNRIKNDIIRRTMADNYLERQREAYEARKAAWEKAKKLGKKTLKHQRKEQGKQSLTPGPSPKERGE